MSCRLLFLLSLLATVYGHCALTDHLRVLEDKTAVHSIPSVDYIYVINLDHRPEKYQQTVDQFAPYGIVPYRFSAVNGWRLPLEALWDVGLVFSEGMRSGSMGTVYRLHNGKECQSHEILEEVGTQYFTHGMARGQIGCVLSHLTVIQDALNSKYEIVWICEDDIEVVRDPHILSRYIHDLDTIVGRDNWDVLFTFRDYRQADGHYDTPWGAIHRPNIDTRNQEQFNINRAISNELRQVGSRFGAHSMIWTKRGMKKALEFYKKYKIFVPYDLDLVLIPTIQMYSVLEDVATNRLCPISDRGTDYGNNR